MGEIVVTLIEYVFIAYICQQVCVSNNLFFLT